MRTPAPGRGEGCRGGDDDGVAGDGEGNGDGGRVDGDYRG